MALVTRNNNIVRHRIPDTLSYSAGTITAVLGTKTYQLVLSGLTGFTLYFLYLRLNGGTLQLFASATTPKAYRVSFPEAMLIGAFYAFDATSLGSFVNIEGKPVSNETAYTPTILGFGTVSTVDFYWRRNGDKLEVRGFWTNGTVQAVSASVSFPTGIVARSTNQIQNAGSFYNSNVSSDNRMNTFVNSGSSVFNFSRDGNLSGALGNAFNNGETQAMNTCASIVSWTDLQLKDL